MMASAGNLRDRMMAARMVRPLKSRVFMLFLPKDGEQNKARENEWDDSNQHMECPDDD